MRLAGHIASLSGHTARAWPAELALRARRRGEIGSAAVADRDDLLGIIKTDAIVHGEVILSSGQRADWYIDMRRILLSGRAAPLAGRIMLEATADLSFEAA